MSQRPIRLFISYSRVDRPFVEKMTVRLRHLYHDVWFDESLHGGQLWWDEILMRIADCDIFIYLLSRESVQSTYCQAELVAARRLHKQILPVLIRARTPIPEDLQAIQIVDMSKGITTDSLDDLTNALVWTERRLSN